MGAELVEGVKVGVGLVEGMVGVELVEGMVGAGVVEGMVGAGPLNWDDEVEGLTTPIGLTSLDFIKGVAMPGGLKGMPTLGGLFGVLRKLESSFILAPCTVVALGLKACGPPLVGGICSWSLM